MEDFENMENVEPLRETKGDCVGTFFIEQLQALLDTCRGEWVAIDFYEDMELLYDGNSKKEALKAKHQRIEDTNGECFVRILTQVF